jgi:hypothetical protein
MTMIDWKKATQELSERFPNSKAWVQPIEDGKSVLTYIYGGWVELDEPLIIGTEHDIKGVWIRASDTFPKGAPLIVVPPGTKRWTLMDCHVFGDVDIACDANEIGPYRWQLESNRITGTITLRTILV